MLLNLLLFGNRIEPWYRWTLDSIEYQKYNEIQVFDITNCSPASLHQMAEERCGGSVLVFVRAGVILNGDTLKKITETFMVPEIGGTFPRMQQTSTNSLIYDNECSAVCLFAVKREAFLLTRHFAKEFKKISSGFMMALLWNIRKTFLVSFSDSQVVFVSNELVTNIKNELAEEGYLLARRYPLSFLDWSLNWQLPIDAVRCKDIFLRWFPLGIPMGPLRLLLLCWERKVAPYFWRR